MKHEIGPLELSDAEVLELDSAPLQYTEEDKEFFKAQERFDSFLRNSPVPLGYRGL